jgi:DNA-binding NtrC family response regulator
MEKKDLAVLVIEDEESLSNLLNRVLTIQGFNPNSAASEEEGIKLISEKGFDIIISDTYDGGNPYGPKIVRRANELKQRPKVIALSGHPEGIKEWIDLNPDYFIKKPLDITALATIVNKLYENNFKD